MTSEIVNDWPLHFRLRVLLTRILAKIGPEYIRAHKHASKHRREIEESERCGCFYCLETFVSEEIEEWTDDGATALRPRCGIDSVVGDASSLPLSPSFLQKMHEYWFERTIKVKLQRDRT